MRPIVLALSDVDGTMLRTDKLTDRAKPAMGRLHEEMRARRSRSMQGA